MTALGTGPPESLVLSLIRASFSGVYPLSGSWYRTGVGTPTMAELTEANEATKQALLRALEKAKAEPRAWPLRRMPALVPFTTIYNPASRRRLGLAHNRESTMARSRR